MFFQISSQLLLPSKRLGTLICCIGQIQEGKKEEKRKWCKLGPWKRFFWLKTRPQRTIVKGCKKPWVVASKLGHFNVLHFRNTRLVLFFSFFFVVLFITGLRLDTHCTYDCIGTSGKNHCKEYLSGYSLVKRGPHL